MPLWYRRCGCWHCLHLRPWPRLPTPHRHRRHRLAGDEDKIALTALHTDAALGIGRRDDRERAAKEAVKQRKRHGRNARAQNPRRAVRRLVSTEWNELHVFPPARAITKPLTIDTTANPRFKCRRANGAKRDSRGWTYAGATGSLRLRDSSPPKNASKIGGFPALANVTAPSPRIGIAAIETGVIGPIEIIHRSRNSGPKPTPP